MNIQGCFSLGLAGLILLSKGFSRVFSRTTVQKPQFFGPAFFMAQLSYLYMITLKTIWLYRPLLAKWCLLLNMLSRFLIAFLPRSKCLLISWLQSPSTVILEPKKINLSLFPFFSPFYLLWSDGTGCHDLSFLNVEFQSSFFILLWPSSRGSLVPLCFLPLGCYHLRLLIFLQANLIPACDSSSPVFHMIYSAYELNKQDDNIQPWCTPFPNFEPVCCSMSSSNCRSLTYIQVS